MRATREAPSHASYLVPHALCDPPMPDKHIDLSRFWLDALRGNDDQDQRILRADPADRARGALQRPRPPHLAPADRRSRATPEPPARGAAPAAREPRRRESPRHAAAVVGVADHAHLRL